MKTRKMSVTGFVLNKLRIHFREDKTKSIFFAWKIKANNICELYRYTEIKTKNRTINKVWLCARRVNMWRTNGIKGYKKANR